METHPEADAVLCFLSESRDALDNPSSRSQRGFNSVEFFRVIVTRNLRSSMSSAPQETRTAIRGAVRSVIASLRKNSRFSRSGIPRRMILEAQAENSHKAAANEDVKNNPIPELSSSRFSAEKPRLVWIGSSEDQLCSNSYQELLGAVVRKGLKLTDADFIATSLDAVEAPDSDVLVNLLEGAEVVVVSTGLLTAKLSAPVEKVIGKKLVAVLALEHVTSNPNLKRQLWEELQPALALLGSKNIG